MTTCTKLKATFSRLLFGVQPPRSDEEEALDLSRAPDVEQQQQRQEQERQEQERQEQERQEQERQEQERQEQERQEQERQEQEQQQRRQPRGPANRSTAPTLLTLPAEIRDLIYTELGLRNNTFHIVSTKSNLNHPRHPRRIRHFRCNRPPSPSTDVTISRCLHLHPEDEHSSSAPLLLVCRALHHETVSILYAQNTFDVAGSPYLFVGPGRLICFAPLIGPHNLRAMRDLRLSWFMTREVLELRGFGEAAERCVRTLREDMGERVRLTVFVCLSKQSSYSQVAGLWAGKWWLEPLARLRGGAAGIEVNVNIEQCEEYADGGVAWAAFQEEVERLVQRGQGVQSPWVEFGEEPGGPPNGFLCVPGKFGRETPVVERRRIGHMGGLAG